MIALAACGGADNKPYAPLGLDTEGATAGSSSGTTGECAPEDATCECELPHTFCEGDANDPLLAMGLCPDRELTADAGTITSDPDAVGIAPGLGQGPTFTPREGNSMAVLGTGLSMDLVNGGPCNHQFPAEFQPASLPDPIDVSRVGDVTCTADPSLVGMGDCSNTIQTQFEQGMSVHDYAEIRVQTAVPASATAVKFDFAFFSTEYPEYFGSEFNDMFIVWLDSEQWTGNISFDGAGNPISLNAGFLDFRDDGGTLQEFSGTCMQGHASTRWLTSQAAVSAGETITLVYAIFDLSDGMLDSFVLLDNFRWGCSAETGGPSTTPDSDSGGAADTTAGNPGTSSGGSSEGGSSSGADDAMGTSTGSSTGDTTAGSSGDTAGTSSTGTSG